MPEHTDVPPPEADDSNAVDDDRAARAATTKSLGNTMAFIGIVVVLAIGTFALSQMDRWGARGKDGGRSPGDPQHV